MLNPSGPNTIYSGDSLDQGFNFGTSESEDGVGVLPKEKNINKTYFQIS